MEFEYGMRFNGEGNVPHNAPFIMRTYHAPIWTTVWLYQRDQTEADRVEEYLWRALIARVKEARDSD